MRRHRPHWFDELAALQLNGGRFRRARWNPGARTLEVLARVEERDGWMELLLRYRNVERLEPALPALVAMIEDVSVELTGQQLSAAAGCWQHRLETRSAGTLQIRFGDLFLARTPVAGPADPLDAGPRFEVLSC
ncbi:MAG TPA: hypothetical protein VK939_03975 [Longimicrobiales bacterium]|nr:hypothetical protein [Longimicrobiales bacterium]